MKEGEKYICKLPKTREMKRRDLNGAWYIKDQRVIVKEDHIKER